MLHRDEPAVLKVPEPTAAFWATKILTTGMGETTSDYLVRQFNPILVIAFVGLIFIGSLGLQFAVRRYVPWIYWLVVVMVGIFGTMVADALHVVIGVPYAAWTIFFALTLSVILMLWRRLEGTLSIHSITTRGRESFYWATILATFALGTAAGDLTATALGLGYLGSGLLFLLLIAAPAIARLTFALNAIFAFWSAYILTRPLGASFADWLGVARERGGLAIETGPVSLVLIALIGLLVAYMSAEEVLRAEGRWA